jgi:RimJ/RimL family protein N-acetyltransferase
MSRVNEHGQPVGEHVDWRPGCRLEPVTLTGRTARVEPLGHHHVDALYDALCVGAPPQIWTYLPHGPFADREEFRAYVDHLRALPATVPFAIVLADGSPSGIAAYLRIDHGHGTAEVGYITYAPEMQRTTAATEVMYLMASHAFDVVGVRRYEWKCDSLNQPSLRAAARLGFSFEGVFRQAMVVKGRNRDTAWFAITDDEWPPLRSRFERWLDPANFDELGHQLTPLQDEE